MTLSQQTLEKLVFEKFVKHTGLNVISFKTCKPPKPDIFCESQRERLYFELTDNTPQKMQKTVHARNEEVRGKAYFIDPFPEVYKQKFTKSYETSSLRCDLVIYFGIHPVAELGVHFEHRMHDNTEWIRQNIQQSEFQKVWIYDYHQDKVLNYVEIST